MARVKLSVFLILVFASKCLAMTHHELEDFANFLAKTSQLSPTLKKGAEPDEEHDEDDAVSDHAWEESGKFEGDLVLNERQRRLIVEDVAEGLSRNGITDGTKRWPNNEVIYFIQREHFTSDQVQAIQNGIDDLARASCVTFRPYKKGDRDAVVIQGSRRGCFSQVGYQGGYQVLNLSGRHPAGRGCFRHGTVVHEMLHTLGFYHMQSSPDRDDYVNVVWANIIEPARHNFRKYNSFSVSDFGVGYDYDSVLHYSRRAFSSNGQDTIVPKQRGAQIGQRIGLSDKDVQKLNRMYCDADSNDGHRQVEDEATEKTAIVKKKAKNKPFEGHGIGYHQGKAVAIKLLPAAETYKLPDVPSFHVFDYFSKTPETLPTPENQGFRIGTEIGLSFHPSQQSIMEEHTKPAVINSEIMLSEKEVKPQTVTNHNSFIKMNHLHSDGAPNVDDEKNISSGQPLDLSEHLNPEYHSTFNGLSQIIKLHVYPSQTPNLDIYKINPENKKEVILATPIRDDKKIKTAVEYIQNFHELNLNNANAEVQSDNQANSHVKSSEEKEKILKDAPLYDQNKFEDTEPYYDSYPIYKESANEHDSESRFVSPQGYAEREHATNYNRNTYTPGQYVKPKDDQSADGKSIPQNSWYADYIPQYNPFTHDHDSKSDTLYIKSNDSPNNHWQDTNDRGNKNDRYSPFHRSTPDYLSFDDSVQILEDWLGTR